MEKVPMVQYEIVDKGIQTGKKDYEQVEQYQRDDNI